ncbi:BamA/TamA family outer membrane protein [Stakelama saccharophila]|uniref:BamA/TamA family outer membrane protein n=1 Tax=Stakelama saccharophila TaxID=3075605 RepID=A0ABZ0B6A0_9SPHN|nr:BamA/TamA family outer membrane protein [Stakelama sp. W311]WNO52925.1 BamA/TamA family outer membrane protein [Stakelama sp. W311]
MLASAFTPCAAIVQTATAQQRTPDADSDGQASPQQESEAPQPAPQDEPIVPDEQFESALPPLGDDINAPLEPMPEPVDRQGVAEAASADAEQDAEDAKREPLEAPGSEIVEPRPLPDEGELAQPLPPIDSFDSTPPPEIAGVEDIDSEIRYETVVEGLEKVDLESRFRDLSALEEGDGEAENAAMVSARAKSDEQLALQLMQSQGYYDAAVTSRIDRPSEPEGALRAVISATPGVRYSFSSITTEGDATVPMGLVDEALPLKPGDPIEAERVQGAEANVSVTLPQKGYPFFQLGQRDILLDGSDHSGAYTLPYDLGPRASFGGFATQGEPVFDPEHIGVLARFDRGDLYDSRDVDDLRKALVSTGLYSTVSVQPQRTGETAPDGTEYVDLLVRQKAGPPRTLAAEAGYRTGQGIRLEGSWTHRNLFPPEGALIVSGVGGTQEQGLSATFRRSNAGRRDRTVMLGVAANHNDYEAYEAYTASLIGRISYDSTPLWQKRFTYSYGFELVGTNEDVWNFDAGERQRKTYFIAALPGTVGFDTSDSLLNPTEGFRINATVSPEAAVKGAFRPYARLKLEGTAYYPVTDSLVIAGRAAVGSIPGIDRDDLPPSRRYYAGGGGSVRGYGYRELGPQAPDGKPIGGRSFNEFSLEARYRFGDFGIVPFIDAGQAYDTIYPRGSDLKFGAGIGGRFYTNFGPLRVDLATPLNPRPGDPSIALYISIGQAF